MISLRKMCQLILTISRTKTIPKNQGTKKDSEVHPKEAAEQEEKHISSKKSKDSGQMSLFDMMQPKES